MSVLNSELKVMSKVDEWLQRLPPARRVAVLQHLARLYQETPEEPAVAPQEGERQLSLPGSDAEVPGL